MKKLFLLLGAFFICFQTHALVGIGHYSEYLGTYQDDTSGGHISFIKPRPYLSINAEFSFLGSFSFRPEAGFVLPDDSHDEGDDASDRSVIFMLYDVGWQFWPLGLVRFGLGTHWTRISNDGGTIEVRNGSTGTLTAFLPSETETAYNTTINFGYEHFILPSLTAKLTTHVWDAFDSDSRSFNIMLGLSYYTNLIPIFGGLF